MSSFVTGYESLCIVVFFFLFDNYVFFFFSSRRRHTRCLSDWISDVCSSDLGATASFWEIGLGAAVVTVDRETGAVTVHRYVSLSDPGRAINPAGVEGQDLGGAMQGLGPALFEAMVYDDGQLVNGSMIDYRLPLFSDLPPAFDALIIEGGGGPGPHGAKGVAESSIINVAPALANAVFAATGVRLRDLPLTPERIWRALRDAESRSPKRETGR